MFYFRGAKAIPIVLIILGGVAATLYFGQPNSRQPASTLPGISPSAGGRKTGSAAPPPVVVVDKKPPSAPGNASPENPGFMVSRLVASGDATNMFAAYKIIAACLKARSFEVQRAQETDPRIRAKFADPKFACDGIGSTQIVSRIEYLKPAAQAGLHGAAAAFASEDPHFSNLKDILATEGPSSSRAEAILTMNDAVSAEWIRQSNLYIEIGATTGDRFSLDSMSNRYENGTGSERDPFKALLYWSAVCEATRLETGKESAQFEKITRRLALGLKPDLVAEAISQGRLLAANTPANNSIKQ